MFDDAVIALALLIALGLGLVIWVVSEWRRYLRFRELGRELGLRFTAGISGHALMHQDFLKLSSFPKSDKQLTSNVLHDAEYNHFLFDCVYESGGDQTTRTVAAIRIGSRRLPRFLLRPKMMWGMDGLIEGFDGNELVFDGDPLFSKQFRLIGEDVTTVRMLFHSNTRQQLIEFSGYSIEGGGREWIIVHPDSYAELKPSELARFFYNAKRIADIFESATTIL